MIVRLAPPANDETGLYRRPLKHLTVNRYMLIYLPPIKSTPRLLQTNGPLCNRNRRPKRWLVSLPSLPFPLTCDRRRRGPSRGVRKARNPSGPGVKAEKNASREKVLQFDSQRKKHLNHVKKTCRLPISHFWENQRWRKFQNFILYFIFGT